MAQDFAKTFYNSATWQGCRDAYISHVHGICERCSKPGYIVHHIIPLTPDNINDPDVTLNWDNLEYLCLDCHNDEHNPSQEVTRAELFFNASGQLVKRYPPIRAAEGLRLQTAPQPPKNAQAAHVRGCST